METETQQWVKCSDMMPENEKVVEVTYKVPKMDTPNEYWYGVCNAFYEDGGVAAERSQFQWDPEMLVFDEFTNTWYVPKGWFEDVYSIEECWQIDNDGMIEVIAWKEKCKPYIEG
jgi:hypothetical protein